MINGVNHGILLSRGNLKSNVLLIPTILPKTIATPKYANASSANVSIIKENKNKRRGVFALW
jgi:hypothetical protein